MSLNPGTIILFGLMAFYGVVTEGNPVTVDQCKNVKIHATNVSVDITPCPEQPCGFHKGTIANCTIVFTPTENVQSGTLEMFGHIGGAKVPFPLPNPKACEGHGLVCPLKEGVPATLKLSFAIKPEYPALKLIAQFDFIDQGNKYVFCFELSVQIEEIDEKLWA